MKNELCTIESLCIISNSVLKFDRLYEDISNGDHEAYIKFKDLVSNAVNKNNILYFDWGNLIVSLSSFSEGIFQFVAFYESNLLMYCVLCNNKLTTILGPELEEVGSSIIIVNLVDIKSFMTYYLHCNPRKDLIHFSPSWTEEDIPLLIDAQVSFFGDHYIEKYGPSIE